MSIVFYADLSTLFGCYNYCHQSSASMPPYYFPLRWESTGDQWWYASPIDWAAANGLYDVVRELLHLDPNLLIKLTSLRRIRRLETLWDDDTQFHDVAKCRSAVANKLLLASEMKNGQNSLVRAGYGGWLLYTAASAGDLAFVTDLLRRDPLLVFGEGEFGVTDIFYAAARSKNSDVFKLLFHFGISPTCCFSAGVELEEQSRESEMRSTFRWEMINRAVHASARGGNLEILKELLGDDSDILVYRDAQGSTVLHTAAGRGQVEVVRDLVQSFEIISSTDSQGNTALHVAAYRGYLAVVEVLIQASPSLKGVTNNNGDTFLHMAVAGFVAPGFRRLDKQMELIKQLIGGELDIEDIINVRNNEGRTVLHTAVSENFQSDLVELLLSVVWIELNVSDADGMTALDLLKQNPGSASSEVLIKRMILAGGVARHGNCVAGNGVVTRMKMHGVGSSPGSCFRISDAEIFLYAGIEGISEGRYHGSSGEVDECWGEIRELDSANSSGKKKLGSVNYAARGLRFLLGEARKNVQKLGSRDSGDDDMEVFHASGGASLRQRYSNGGGNSNNKRVFSFTRSSPSPSSKEKFRAGLAQGVLQSAAHLATPSSHRSRSSGSSPTSTRTEDQKVVEMGRDGGCSSNAKAAARATYKTGFLNSKLMNKYLCFGTQGVAVVDSISGKRLAAF